MQSLRARLVAGVVAVAAVGLMILAGVTYAEQRSFQLDRIDQQVHAAVFPVSGQLDQRVGGPAQNSPDPDDQHGGGGHDDNFPYGTYGERRDASGARVASLPLTRYGQTTPETPNLPKDLPLNRPVSVSADGTRYRVLAVPDRFDSGATVVAVPLRDVDQTLHRLLLVEALVIAAVLAVLAAMAYGVVRIGLRPLDRMALTAGKIAGGDLSHRVEPDTERTEVGRLGHALNRMLERLEEAFSRREASEDRLRQFLADASHELRTPLSSIRGYAELYRMGATSDTDMAMRRIEEEATRMGPGSTRSVIRGAIPWRSTRSRTTRSGTPRRRRRTARSRSTRPPCRRSSAIPTSCTRSWPTCCATRSSTRRRGRRSR
jgi:two-component system OmpR family sensor kinase